MKKSELHAMLMKPDQRRVARENMIEEEKKIDSIVESLKELETSIGKMIYGNVNN